eukprot:gene1826-2160_t
MELAFSLPPVLPLLPLSNQVLLPTAFLRVQVASHALRSVSLLEHFSSKSSKELLVAAVPYFPDTKDQQEHEQTSKHVKLERLTPVGCAARVLQLSRLVQVIQAAVSAAVGLYQRVMMRQRSTVAKGGGSTGASRGGITWGGLNPGRRAGGSPPNNALLGLLEDEEEDDLALLLQKLAAAQPPAEVLKAAAREARRLRQGGEQQPGAAAARAYLELLADLPWDTLSYQLHQKQQQQEQQPAAAQAAAGRQPPPPPPMSLSAAQALLDSQHYGLDKVKKRIIQHLAVSRLRGGSGKAPVLCFIGPPGVGKTSLAKSIAEVLRVPFGRIALGGVRDESEIRGHRRTYVGAMPGRLISSVRKAGCKDPLLLLDEVDKLGHDHRGDPAAALLEVLDPEQNHAFTDTYLGLPFDLSNVTFVCTANRASDIPPPLLDRLEVIELAGYTLNEKVHICQSHLLPELLSEHGLGPHLVSFPPDVLEYVVTAHTREAGVRGLRRALAAVCRHVALNVHQAARVIVDLALVEAVLGPAKYQGAADVAAAVSGPGVAAGLVWTAAGGGVQYVECVRVGVGQPGQLGQLTLTGQDGPSAGITLAVALTSLLSGRSVRKDTAMTGELTLRGLVLPVSGKQQSDVTNMLGF